jgi:hypothetical protein
VTSNLDTVKRLMALALNEAASPEESRTAAVAACRMIAAEFEIVQKEYTTTVHPTPSLRNWAKYRVTHVARCKFCSSPIYPGTWAYFKDKFGSLHEACFNVGMF